MSRMRPPPPHALSHTPLTALSTVDLRYVLPPLTRGQPESALAVVGDPIRAAHGAEHLRALVRTETATWTARRGGHAHAAEGARAVVTTFWEGNETRVKLGKSVQGLVSV